MDLEKAGVLSVFLAPVFTGSQVSHVSGVAEAAGSDWASEVPPTVGEEQVWDLLTKLNRHSGTG